MDCHYATSDRATTVCVTEKKMVLLHACGVRPGPKKSDFNPKFRIKNVATIKLSAAD